MPECIVLTCLPLWEKVERGWTDLTVMSTDLLILPNVCSFLNSVVPAEVMGIETEREWEAAGTEPVKHSRNFHFLDFILTPQNRFPCPPHCHH